MTRLARALSTLSAFALATAFAAACSDDDESSTPAAGAGGASGAAGASGGTAGASSGAGGADNGAAGVGGGADLVAVEVLCQSIERHKQRCGRTEVPSLEECRASNTCQLYAIRPEFFEAGARCYDSLSCDISVANCPLIASEALAGQENEPFYDTCLAKAFTCGEAGQSEVTEAERRCRNLATSFRPAMLDRVIHPCIASVCTSLALDDCLADSGWTQMCLGV